MSRLSIAALVALSAAACDAGSAPPSGVGLQIPEPTDPLRPKAERGVVRTDVETTDYAIDATLHPDEHRIEGLERITFRNRSTRAVEQLAFHLYMNAFSAEDTAWMKEGRGSHRANGQGTTSPWGYIDVRSVRLVEDGTEIPMVLGSDPSVATVDLPSALAPGDTLVLDVAWNTQLPEVFARTGYAENFVPQAGRARAGRTLAEPRFYLSQ